MYTTSQTNFDDIIGIVFLFKYSIYTMVESSKYFIVCYFFCLNNIFYCNDQLFLFYFQFLLNRHSFNLKFLLQD